MRAFVLTCLLAVAVTAAVLPEESYLPPSEKVASEYLPPSEDVAEVKQIETVPEESAALSNDGYMYKTVRKLKYRQRRDVSEIKNEYLPPSEEPSNEYLPPAEIKEAIETAAPEESAVLSDDGYHYKTIRKLKYRHRRDVSEVVAPEYLPPAEKSVNLPEAESTEVPEESAALADDGYHYKTVRKLKYRHRRDVSEVVAPEYLPPVEKTAQVEEAEPTETTEESAVLADDGYQYKTVRRLKYRQRRDISEVANQYLAPVEEPANEYLPAAEVKESIDVTEVPEESAVLSNDGYRYKTIRKLKYRHRRDVSEVVAPEYLPPAEKSAIVEEEVETTAVPDESAALTEDGYRYKTVRKLKYRIRRDISEEIAPEYLPPAETAEEVPEASAKLSDDGYQYKTVRKLKYRHRRDVSEIKNEYLPPVEETETEVPETAEVKIAVEETNVPQDSAVLADDGYQYKTVRRLKYRIRRDVPEVVAPEYLPPVDVKEISEIPEESAALADDGYRYKTVRKLKFRHRRDVTEIAPEYLPPVEKSANEYLPPLAEATESSAGESAVLADDGYHYKTVKRFKYRN